MHSEMWFCEICFVILSLTSVNPFPTASKTEQSAAFGTNPNIKLFSAYGEYPSSVEEINRPVKRENNLDEEHQLETQESGTDSYVIQKILPKKYRVATVADPQRVITTYYDQGRPIITDEYANVVKRVLLDNDVTGRSVPFYENGLGPRGNTKLFLNNNIVPEKVPLKVLVVEGEQPLAYQNEAITVSDLTDRQHRALLGPTVVSDPVILTLGDRTNIDNIDDRIIKYYGCQTIDTHEPAICDKEVLKTYRTSRQLVDPHTVGSNWPRIPGDLVVSSITRSSTGGNWRDFVTFSVEDDTDPLADQQAEEDRINEVKSTINGDKVEDDKQNVTDKSNEIDETEKPKERHKCNCMNSHEPHMQTNYPAEETYKEDQQTANFQIGTEYFSSEKGHTADAPVPQNIKDVLLRLSYTPNSDNLIVLE